MKEPIASKHLRQFASDGLLLLGWMILRAGLQAATVILLARQLGAQSYGQFVAVLAIFAFLTPFVGAGLQHMLLRNVARDPTNNRQYLHVALSWWHRTLLPCLGISLLLAWYLLPERMELLVLAVVAIAELTAVSLTELCARYWQAKQQPHAFGAINAGLPIVRFATLILLWVCIENPDISTVWWAYSASGLAYAGFLWLLLKKAAQKMSSPLPEPMTALSGLPFSFAAFATRLQSEFNKPLLAQAAFNLAGTYNVAQRITDMAILPISALQEVLWPRLYAQSKPLRQLSLTGGALLLLALALGCMLWIMAPFISLIFGSDYENSVKVLQLLAWLPTLQVFRSLLNFHAIYHGRMHQISWTYGGGALVSVMTASILIPLYGLNGAVWTSYAVEITMIISLIYGAFRTQSSR